MDDRGWCSRLARFEHLQGRGTNLRDANLTGAKITNEQLAEARDLVGATLPDGTVMTDQMWVDFKNRHRVPSSN
ncbi:MAG: hypothetical protein ACE5Q6_12550 [Dehalococcoidia bacterium]